MRCYDIENAVNDLIPIFSEAGYTEKTITELKRNIQKIVILHQAHGKQIYDSEIVDSYIEKLRKDCNAGAISRSRKNALIKAALYVREFVSTGTIVAGVRECPEKLPAYYGKILDEVKKSNKWSESLNRNIIYAAHTYFLFLADCGIQDISMVSEDTVRRYIMAKTTVISPNSIDTIRRNLKHLHIWLYENAYVSSDFSDILSFVTPKKHHIKKPIPQEEISLILRTIDRRTDIGKRNYAMFMIAIVTGLRSVDISALKFSDIDWINGEIRITQRKTDVPLALPLTKDIGEALKDYILHGRPKSDVENIFITMRPPIQPLGRRAVYSAFNQVRAAAGLKKCPFHALRRTVGTNMVVAGVPVTTVAQVLGHSEISSTKQYISLDSIHLRECALSLTEITRKGDNV